MAHPFRKISVTYKPVRLAHIRVTLLHADRVAQECKGPEKQKQKLVWEPENEDSGFQMALH